MSKESMRAWRAKNPERARVQSREAARVYRERAPEALRASQKKWLAKPENAATVRVARASRRRANPEKYRAKGRAAYARTTKVYLSELLRSSRARHAGRWPGEAMALTSELLTEKLLRQGGRCFWTGVELDFVRGSPWKVSIDRLDNGRGYTAENTVLACWFANRARGTMSVDEFERAMEVMVKAWSGKRGGKCT